MSASVQRTSSIFCLLYHFMCTCFAQYNMAGVNLIDQKGYRVLNYGPVVNDKAIEKSIFVALKGKTRKQCLLICSSTPGCVAYNHGSDGGICQLSSDTSPCALVSKPGFIHHGVFNFRKCYKVAGFNVSVTSGLKGEFVVGEQRFTFTGNGNTFLAVHKNGSTHGNVEIYDLLHSESDLADMNAYLNGLPDAMVVLMAVIGRHHLPTTSVGNIPLLGSNYTTADFVGMEWWALVGFKGTRQPWITEALDSSSTSFTRNATTYFYY